MAVHTDDDRAELTPEFSDVSEPESRPRWPGMSYFREHDHQHFFGRDDETKALLRRLKRPKSGKAATLWIHGAPGVGKTSLVCAGLLPRLRQTWGDDIRALQITPEGGESGYDMICGIAQSILDLAPTDSTIDSSSRLRQFVLLLEEDRTEAADFLAACYRRSSSTAQATTRGDSICIIFIDDLDKMAPADNGRILPTDDSGWVTDHLCDLLSFLHQLALTSVFPCITTLRTPNTPIVKDALAKIGKPTLGSWMEILPLEPAELRPFFETSPALASQTRSTKVTISEEMLDIIMLDLQGTPEAIPFASENLRERCRHAPGAVLLTIDDHNQRRSGIRKQFARIAEQALLTLPDTAAAEFPRLMGLLHPIQKHAPQQRQGPVSLPYLSLVVDQPAMRQLVDTLTDYHILTLTGDTHEESRIALTLPNALPQWPRAQDWLENDTTMFTSVDEFTHKLDHWKVHHRTPVLLIQAPKALARAKDLLAYHQQRPFLDEELAAYFAESIAFGKELDILQKQLNQKRVLLFGGIGVAALGVVVLCLLFF